LIYQALFRLRCSNSSSPPGFLSELALSFGENCRLFLWVDIGL
jgi:hypothetical protein